MFVFRGIRNFEMTLLTAVLITSVPLFAIVVRYNLLRGDICSNRMAIFLSAVLPWLIAIPFQTRVSVLRHEVLQKIEID